MRKLLIAIGLFIIIFSLISCSSKISNNIDSKDNDFLPYEKLTLIGKSDNNREWNEKIKKQLTDLQGEMTADRLIKDGEYKKYTLELTGIQSYDNKHYPYKITADIVLWLSNDYYTICEVNNCNIENWNESIEVIREESLSIWTDNLELLKIIPVNQVVKFDLGGEASFKEKKQEKIGPFTIVYNVNISYPSSQFKM